MVSTPPRVDAVIVVRHTGQDILWRPERDRWSHELMAKALETILANARAAGIEVHSEEELLALPTETFVQALYATSRAEPLDAEYPMFIIYTSGSTGKPKGVVHVHGGYVAGVAYTMKVSFDAEPGDTIYVVADPGWITGQSYMICATLTTRCTGIITEGSPVFPSAGRFASIIERYRVRVFKAGVTFLKTVMSDPQNTADARQYDMSSLRVCTFCAEPVSPAVQQFGMELMSPQYINSYWATEHGGMSGRTSTATMISRCALMRTPIRCPGLLAMYGCRRTVTAMRPVQKHRAIASPITRKRVKLSLPRPTPI
jgi:3-hydroxypropionyl-CoA synthetase (EC 6.2.1.-)/3-hydroxypropionyl-CoA dehydratase (EC 4.2.1.-)/acrylyl-CoA reductase (NADPH) (EC 1.3.1.-)